MLIHIFSWTNRHFKYETPEVEAFDSLMKLDTRLGKFLDDLYADEIDNGGWDEMTLDEKREFHDEMVGYGVAPAETNFWVVSVEVQ